MASWELLNLNDEQIAFLRDLAHRGVVEATIVVRRKIGTLDISSAQIDSAALLFEPRLTSDESGQFK